MTKKLEAAKELLRRTKASTELIAFTEYTYPKFVTASHHRRVAAELEAVERGECDRLMLMLPPRHGKSELASRRFPAFCLGRRPDRQFISVSAASGLADDFGRDVRNIIASPEYGRVFNTKLAADSQAKGKWHTEAGGVYYSVGIGGQILGRGADTALVDDPFGSMADALSETTRNAVWSWYQGTLYNRLMPGGAIVVIGHRMHEEDLQGRLLAQQGAGGDRWRVVEIPALSDDGEALWPEWYDRPALERIRRNTLPRFWSALYQQRPTPDDGDYFKREWIKPVEEMPSRESLRIYGASDYAVTSGGGDYTVHVVAGVDAGGRIHLLDLWRGQTDSAEWIDQFCRLVREWRPHEWGEESGQIRASVGPFLERRMRETGARVARRQVPSRADKATRAQAIRGRMALDGLHIPIAAPWRGELEAELLSFPAGRHDDMVDALSLLGQMLDTMSGPRVVPKFDAPRVVAWGV